MSKVGRNDPCPCGSGKKYKRCCQAQMEERARVARLEAERARLEAERATLEDAIEGLAGEDATFKEVDGFAERVLELIDARRYEEAEATARELGSKYPDEPLAIERLGQVHEARGTSGLAAQEYRRAVALMDELGEGRYCDCCRARLVKAIRRLEPDRPAPALLRDPQ